MSIQSLLDSHRPEEQHGFRSGRHLDEHLLTAHLFLDRTLAVSIPVWMLSLDLAKAFDRVDSGALWFSLCEWTFHTVHLINKDRSLEKEGAAALFKSTQACDQDACLVRKYLLQSFIGQNQNGEHGGKVVRLDLVLVMVCHHF